jgi:ribosomal protein L11 methylase PrmA
VARFAHAVPEDLTGRTVLDIGCNAGFYAIEMKRRGAARVVGVDSDERYLDQARFAAEVTGRTSSSASSRSTTSRSSASASTSCSSWGCSTTCAIRSWPST